MAFSAASESPIAMAWKELESTLFGGDCGKRQAKPPLVRCRDYSDFIHSGLNGKSASSRFDIRAMSG